MWKEINERKWWHLWPYLAVGDTLVGVVVLPNFVASYWMGTWLIFDFYLFPRDIHKSAWICYGVGNVFVLCSILSQGILRAWLIPEDGKRTWKFVLSVHMYKYIMALIGVMQWRGLAYVTVLYTGMSLTSTVIGLVVATILLALLRNHLGILTPPLTMALDPGVEDSFIIPTKFSCEPGLNWKFVLDALFTVFVITTFAGFALKGYWVLLEMAMPVNENDPIELLDTGFISLLIFYGLVSIPIIGQYELMKLNKRVEEKYPCLVATLEELFIAILGILPMLFWRAVYLIHLSFLTPEYYKLYLWISHVVGFLGVCVMRASSSMIPLGCVSDKEAFQNEFGIFDYRYSRFFLDKRRTIRQQEKEDKLDFSELNKQTNGDHHLKPYFA
ncbi:uncharacterized protein LOC133179472 [Saccostrea echinata]|uniref:uncharacterized protein LOC133179472 n=1 Tax=Saccostrea echinata TaxID=191078 RepID=UPI002A81DCBF|nr:uncharacterized protein LOC133179472 [Saccostrea echinata]